MQQIPSIFWKTPFYSTVLGENPEFYPPLDPPRRFQPTAMADLSLWSHWSSICVPRPSTPAAVDSHSDTEPHLPGHTHTLYLSLLYRKIWCRGVHVFMYMYVLLLSFFLSFSFFFVSFFCVMYYIHVHVTCTCTCSSREMGQCHTMMSSTIVLVAWWVESGFKSCDTCLRSCDTRGGPSRVNSLWWPEEGGKRDGTSFHDNISQPPTPVLTDSHTSTATESKRSTEEPAGREV